MCGGIGVNTRFLGGLIGWRLSIGARERYNTISIFLSQGRKIEELRAALQSRREANGLVDRLRSEAEDRVKELAEAKREAEIGRNSAEEMAGLLAEEKRKAETLRAELDKRGSTEEEIKWLNNQVSK